MESDLSRARRVAGHGVSGWATAHPRYCANHGDMEQTCTSILQRRVPWAGSKGLSRQSAYRSRRTAMEISFDHRSLRREQVACDKGPLGRSGGIGHRAKQHGHPVRCGVSISGTAQPHLQGITGQSAARLTTDLHANVRRMLRSGEAVYFGAWTAESSRTLNG